MSRRGLTIKNEKQTWLFCRSLSCFFRFVATVCFFRFVGTVGAWLNSSTAFSSVHKNTTGLNRMAFFYVHTLPFISTTVYLQAFFFFFFLPLLLLLLLLRQRRLLQSTKERKRSTNCSQRTNGKRPLRLLVLDNTCVLKPYRRRVDETLRVRAVTKTSNGGG